MHKILKQILKDDYRLSHFELSSLDGNANENYLVRDGDTRYILKKYVHQYGLAELIHAENKVLDLLNAKLPGRFQIPISTVSGKDFVVNTVGADTFIFRLLSYIEGELLINTRPGPAMFYSLGKLLGKLDAALLDYRDTTIEGRVCEWDILHIDRSIGWASHIQNPGDRKLVDYFYRQYNEFIRPQVPRLRKSIIYADANDLNIITRDNEVASLIDFGDLMHTLLANELAIALAYCLMGKDDPLAWAKPLIEGYCRMLPLKEEEIDSLYYLIAARLCISVCKSARARIENPGNTYLLVSEQPAWKVLHQWIRINPLRASTEFRAAAGLPPVNSPDIGKDLQKRWKHISKSLSVSYQEPIRMEKAAFQYMYDDRGNTFLDARNNISHVGHCHPKVTEAGTRMMHTLNTNTRYVYGLLNDYAERLLEKFPSPLNKIFFVNSGSAASDLAIRLSNACTGKEKILVMEQGYHGNTKAGIDISHYKFSGKGGDGQREHIIIAPIYDFNKEKLIRDLKPHEGAIAAFIAEPVIGCGGQVPLPEGYLNELYPFIRNQGGVCISDEVQTGFGRLGKAFWGFELYEVVPDIVILGKPMGNGHPMAAVVTTSQVAASFEGGMEFFSSFGGNPVSCAIGLAVLETIKEEMLQENALEVGNYLKNKLEALKSKHACIADVRGYGFYLGVELIDDPRHMEKATELASRICNGLRQHFIMVGTDGPFENVLKIKPPLCFTRENADELVEALDLVIQKNG